MRFLRWVAGTGASLLALSGFLGAVAFGQVAEISALLPSGATVATSLAPYYDHRPYQGATGLNGAGGYIDPEPSGVGLSVGLETTLVSGAGPIGLLASLGGSTGSLSLPTLPVFPGFALPQVRPVIHKGLGSRVDVGLSGTYLPGILLGAPQLSLWNLGGDIKATVFQQEEGPTVALRLCFSYSKLGFTISQNAGPLGTLSIPLYMQTYTFTPHLLMSRRLSFVEPYLGAAYILSWGSAVADLTAVPAIAGGGSAIAKTGFYSEPLVYLGASIVIPGIRLQLVPEMGFKIAGLFTGTPGYSFGLKTGVAF